MDKTSLGDRMKMYELRSQSMPVFFKELPVLVRIDGRGFSKWTKGLARPYQPELLRLMQDVAQSVMKNPLSECVLAYGQSDEITFLLRPTPWDRDGQFALKRDKIISLTAAEATRHFNELRKMENILVDKPGGVFDARAFQVPTFDEAVNALVWRQQDATRNSIQMLGHTHFSHKRLHGLSCDEIQELLWQEADINWNNMPVAFKRGWCVTRAPVIMNPEDMNDIPEMYRPKKSITRRKIVVDSEPPIFTQNRDYILSLMEAP